MHQRCNYSVRLPNQLQTVTVLCTCSHTNACELYETREDTAAPKGLLDHDDIVSELSLFTGKKKKKQATKPNHSIRKS